MQDSSVYAGSGSHEHHSLAGGLPTSHSYVKMEILRAQPQRVITKIKWMTLHSHLPTTHLCTLQLQRPSTAHTSQAACPWLTTAAGWLRCHSIPAGWPPWSSPLPSSPAAHRCHHCCWSAKARQVRFCSAPGKLSSSPDRGGRAVLTMALTTLQMYTGSFRWE